MVIRIAMCRSTVTEVLPAKLRFQRGFTLVEVMAGIGIVVIALFALIALQSYTLRVQGFSEGRHLALTLAASRLAQAEAMLEENFEADPAQALLPDLSHPEISVEILVNDDFDPNVKTVTAKVVWREDRGTMNFRLETSVARDV